MVASLAYPGRELELFAAAGRWHAYWRDQVRPFLGAEVLEVGAGIATHSVALAGQGARRWIALEPDAAMAREAGRRLAEAGLTPRCAARHGTTETLAAGERFDTVLYIDVLEHIADDREELARGYAHLRPGGHLVVLAPAHQSLYSAFDAAIGHHRRYTRAALLEMAPSDAAVARARYLDSVGLLASAANRLLLRQDMPTAGQIALWDRLMVPLSRLADPALGYRAGKSVLAVWRKPGRL